MMIRMKISPFWTGALAAAALACITSGAQAQGGYLGSFRFGGGYRPILNYGYPVPFVNLQNGQLYFAGNTPYPGINYFDDNAAQENDPARQDAPKDKQSADKTLAKRNAIPRTSDAIEARIEKDGRVLIKWQGDPSMVAGISFFLLDKDQKTLKEQAISRLPAQARFTMTNKTAFYKVKVEYLNGTTTSVVSPL